MTQAAKAPTGLSIWNAMREELRLNLYPLPFTTLPPSIFHVYLHPADFDRIEGIVPAPRRGAAAGAQRRSAQASTRDARNPAACCRA